MTEQQPEAPVVPGVTPRPSVLSGILRSQVTAAIEEGEIDDEWPAATIEAVMAVVESALEVVRERAGIRSPASALAGAAAASTGALEPISVAAIPDREALGRIVHAERLEANARLPRPFILPPWEERTPDQQELDMAIGEAVAAAVRGPAEAKLAEVEGACRDIPDCTDRATVLKRRILAIIGTKGDGHA